MRATSAVVLVIDRLGAPWLGPYGNTWLETPNFSRLAAQSVLCETVVADSTDWITALRGYWTGRHAMEPSVHDPLLASLAAAAGTHSILLSDTPRVAEHPLAMSFAERGCARRLDLTASAEEIEQTGFYCFFDAAIKELRDCDQPSLIWLHTQGMTGAWDAPLALRYQFADEEDPQPPDLIEPPNLRLSDDFDPDQLLGLVHAYAGQVALADMCLGMLLDALDEHPLADETLLIVTSPRGYPLGEHRRVGPCDEALYSELLHVPMLVRFPRHEHALSRSHAILQPQEVHALIAESCQWQHRGAAPASHLLRELRGEAGATSTRAVAVAPSQRAIRTPAWLLRESRAQRGASYELFAKPDDRWEANEISSRCGEAVELLAAELDRFEAAARAGRLAEPAPLAELLCDVWR